MVLIDGIEHFTEQELHKSWMDHMKAWKFELRAENAHTKKYGSCTKEFNFSRFKANCRDRKHNALAGHCKTKDSLYFWYADKY